MLDDVTTILRHNMGYGILGKLVEITSFFHCLLVCLFDLGFRYVRGTVSSLLPSLLKSKACTLDEVTTIIWRYMGCGVLEKLMEI